MRYRLCYSNRFIVFVVIVLSIASIVDCVKLPTLILIKTIGNSDETDALFDSNSSNNNTHYLVSWMQQPFRPLCRMQCRLLCRDSSSSNSNSRCHQHNQWQCLMQMSQAEPEMIHGILHQEVD